MDEVLAVDLPARLVILADEQIPFDYLIMAPGSRHSYFGKHDWEQYAHGLKTLADALDIRERLLLSFEKAERVLHTPAAKNISPSLSSAEDRRVWSLPEPSPRSRAKPCSLTFPRFAPKS